MEPSGSTYATPIIIVKKKDGTNRYCIDFRKINKHTNFDAVPMPDQEAIMTRISGSKYFSKLDLCKGYWQIPLDEQSKKVTAFQRSIGLLQFVMMLFGLVNASASFNRLMRRLYGEQHVETFVDDILIHTAEWDEHVKLLVKVLNVLHSAGLTARPSKCELGKQCVEYLGHNIGGGMIRPVEGKLESISNMSIPKTKKEVRSFLGMTGYYRQYVPDYASIATPLTDLTKKLAPNKVAWKDFHQVAFERLKSVLCSRPVLNLANLDKDFILQADASQNGVGADLLQEHDGEHHPVAYARRKLNHAEENYPVIEKECLAIVWASTIFLPVSVW